MVKGQYVIMQIRMKTLCLIVMGLSATIIVSARAQNEQSAAASNTQQTLELKTSGWQSKCVARDRQAPLECVIEASAVLSNNGQRLTDFSIRIPDAKAQPLMLVRVPLEVALTAGLNLKVDDGKTFSYPLQTCNNDGCFVGEAIDKDQLAAMIKGANVEVSFKDTAQNDIRLKLPLKGSGDAYKGVK